MGLDLESLGRPYCLNRPLQAAVLEWQDPSAGRADEVMMVVPGWIDPLEGGRLTPEFDPLDQAELLELLERSVDRCPADVVEVPVDLQGCRGAVP